MENNEDKKYPIGGFAPGSYTCICVTCKNEFTGDKRAVQCEDCATKDNRQMTVIAADIKRIKDEQALNRYETISSEMDFAISVLESLLPKEEDQIIKAHLYGVEKPQMQGEYPDGKAYFNETYKPYKP